MNNDDNYYMTYYNDDYHSDNEIRYRNNNRKRKQQKNDSNTMLYLVLGLIAIVLIFVIFTNSCSQRGTGNNTNPLVLDVNNINLEIGGSTRIIASVSNDNNPTILWESSDPTIVSVDKGIIKAKKAGIVVITVTYTTSDNQTFKQECTVIVNNKETKPPTTDKPTTNPPTTDKPTTNPPSDSSDRTNPTLNVSITNGTSEWYANDVAIKVSASDDKGISSVKYAINCDSNCTYTNVDNNGTFKVSNNGTNNITVLATDKSGNQTKKNLVVKIDKTAPIVKLDTTGTKIYNNTGSVQVCASCTDADSGCTQNQICKIYTSNQTNITFEFSDKANNKTKTVPFSIIIDKTAPTCSLKINESTGVLTGTASDSGGSGIAYYGYNSNYTGSNTQNKNGVFGMNYFYVKDNAGNVGRCEIDLIYEYRSRECYEKEATWSLRTSKTCGDGYYNSTPEKALRQGLKWYRTGCVKAIDEIDDPKYVNCNNDDTCKCCKEYSLVSIDGCKSFEGSTWSDWTGIPLEDSTFVQVEKRLVEAID